MIKKKILVVGGGFRGIVIADKLKKSNNVDLVEKLPYLGGILYSEKWNGFYLDKGVHIFDNTNNEDTRLIQKILKNKFRKISVKYGSRITDKTSDKVAVPDFTTLDIKIQRKIAQELFECTYLKQKSKIKCDICDAEVTDIKKHKNSQKCKKRRDEKNINK